MTIKIEKVFVLLALIFGLIFIILIPPIQSVDEDSHFLKSYLIANGQFFPTTINNNQVFLVPDEIFKFSRVDTNIVGNLDGKYSFKDMYFGSWLNADYSSKHYQTFSTSTTNPIAHIIPAAGMFVGRVLFGILHLSNYMTPYNYLFFGRLASLLFFIFLMYYAIKITPHFKYTFTLLALLPMTLSLASSISYDTPLIALAFLFIACVLNLTYNEDIKIIPMKYIIVFAITFLFFLNVKYVYLPLFFLLLIVPKQKFGARKDILKFLGLVFGAGVAVFIFVMIVNRILQQGTSSGGSYSSQQISFVLGHPIKTIVIFFRTISHKYLEYITGVVGKFGWADTNFPLPFVVVYFYSMIVIAFSEGAFFHKFNWKKHLLVFLISMLVLAGVFGGMYIYWTSYPQFGGVGARVIEGVQGRYLLPLLPLLVLICSSKLSLVSKRLTRQMARIVKYSPLLMVTSLIYTTMVILLRFWI